MAKRPVKKSAKSASKAKGSAKPAPAKKTVIRTRTVRTVVPAPPAPRVRPAATSVPHVAAPPPAPRPYVAPSAQSKPDISTGAGLAALAVVVLLCFGIYGYNQGWFTNLSVKPLQQQQTQQEPATPAPPPKMASATPVDKRAEQQRLCDEQADKRRDLGIPSEVVWDSPYTCRATGGMVEAGKI
jgi:uncharacterized protein HemX